LTPDVVSKVKTYAKRSLRLAISIPS